MAESLFSPYWYRVAGLHPRLVSTIRIARQTFKGEQWHVLSNPASGRQFRVNTLGYQLVGRLDGRHSVQQIWDILVRDLGNDAPSQHEVQFMLSELAAAGMLQSETAPDLASVFEAKRRRQAARRQSLLSFKVSLFDPTPLLDRLQALAGPLLHRGMLAVWFVLTAIAGLAAAMHWAELQHYGGLHLASTQSLLLMWLLYPPIKVLHELGHALAIRHWGGEVREMGVTVFLVMPVPYVDGSAASGFSSKYRRMAVSAMGILVETTLAALALLVWLNVGDGWVRQSAFAVMIIAGVSSVLVNANPLMRFDGYYVLSDWLEVPGLAARSEAWLRYLGERWVLGNRQLRAPAASAGSRVLLSLYGVASLVYRLLLLSGVALWLAGKQLALGLALAAWVGLRFVLMPLWKLLRMCYLHPRLETVRLRAGGTVTALLAGTLLFALAWPMPHTTRASGLVWLPDEARVRTEVDGFVEEVRVIDGQSVKRGDVLAVMSNPDLEAQRSQLATRLASQQLAYQGALLSQPGTAVALGETLEALTAQLAEANHKIEQLTLRAPVDGQVGMGAARDLPGRYFARGSVIANVLDPQRSTVRIALPQSEVDLLRRPARRIVVRTAEQPRLDLPAELRAQEPAASYDLPGPVLGDRAGGPFATDPADPNGTRTLEPVFIIDLALPRSRLQRIGSRAWVHIEHEPLPLAKQWARSLRQLLVAPLDGGARRPGGG